MESELLKSPDPGPGERLQGLKSWVRLSWRTGGRRGQQGTQSHGTQTPGDLEGDSGHLCLDQAES